MAATRLNRTLRCLFRAPAYLYRWKCSWLLGRRFLMLVHIGRRTGLRRYTVLEVIEYRKEGPEAVVMSAFGRNADWLRNIEANPGAEVIIGSRRFIAGYERANRLVALVIRSVLSRLLGWRYDGSEDARSRLVKQLPLIAFRPAA